ncbi:DUF6671 family protein [Cecembia sp.]|uniref:DUF6671 family protein n=1 Tax=Cecembia sp. TaxID=1898110 RepID=UPI00344DD73F
MNRGLSCTYCEKPTQGILSHILSFQQCGYVEEKIFPENKKEEDRLYCDYCNK